MSRPGGRAVKAAALLFFLAVCAAGNSAAQCPDGTPPPCAARPVRLAAAPASNSVAVLYFDNLSRDTSDAYLADGLTEEIIIRLGQVQRLAVKSRFEVQRFRGRAPLDPATVGRSLGAAYLVTGSVQRSGDRVRMRVELLRSATRAQVWGDVFDKASSDLLTVESDIAEAVVTAITGQLLPAERTRLSRPPTSDPVAYEQYLRGLQAAHNFGDEAALRSAVAYFDRAIARDSSFASAFAGKAVAWSMLADGYVTPREGYGQTRVAANQALARDSSQALGWAMLANAVIALDLDAHEAERLARRGIALDPHGGWSRLFLSGALWAEGQTDSAVNEARRAWQDDSLFTIMSVNYVNVLVGTGRLDTAVAMIPRIHAILPPADADPLEGMVLGARGDWRGAARLLDWRYYGGCFDAGMYVRALLALGDTVAARATVDSMVSARTPGYYNPMALARAYAALGDVDRGIEWLRRAFEERTAMVVWVRQDPELAPLQGRSALRRARPAAAVLMAHGSARVPIPAEHRGRGLPVARLCGVLGLLASVPPAAAQCPDGTPPPCAARSPRLPAPPAPNSVAVMYLDNESRDTSDAYLADGLTEEITTKLGQIGRLAVTSNTTMRRYRSGAEVEPAALGRILRVAQLVSGSVRRAGHRIRVNVELLRARDGVQLWADAYDQTDADLLGIEETIARSVATAIAGRLLPGEQATLAARPTHNPEAYDHLLRGNFSIAQRTPAAGRRALAEYQAAAALDPTFALAYGRIGLAYALFIDWGWPYPGLTEDSLLVLGSAAADRALQLDSQSTDGWMARAYMDVYLHPTTFEGSLPAFERAIALDSRNAEAHHQYASILMSMGRDSAAAEEYRRALTLDPPACDQLGQLRGYAVPGAPDGRGVAATSTAPWPRIRRRTTRTSIGRTCGSRWATWPAPAPTSPPPCAPAPRTTSSRASRWSPRSRRWTATRRARGRGWIV